MLIGFSPRIAQIHRSTVDTKLSNQLFGSIQIIKSNLETFLFQFPFTNISKRFLVDSAHKMFKNSATNVRDLSKDQLKAWIASFDTVLTDCDGVLWLYNDHIAGSREVMNRFKEIGKQTFFVTNNSTKTREEFATKANTMGFNVTKDDVVSTAFVVAQYLKQRNFTGKVYVIGSAGVAQELDAVGFRHTGTGVSWKLTVGQGFGSNFEYFLPSSPT
jgi:Haloacid dehalogenase-like hydrolase